MAQGIKVEQRNRELFFTSWLLLFADFFRGSGKAAADKRGEPQEAGWRPPLKVLPFWNPLSLSPPRVRSTRVSFYRISAFCPTLGWSVWWGNPDFCYLHQKDFLSSVQSQLLVIKVRHTTGVKERGLQKGENSRGEPPCGFHLLTHQSRTANEA